MSKRATKKGRQVKRARRAPVPQSAEKKGLSTGSKVVIAAFAVIMALSMMLPSLAGLIGGDSSGANPTTIEDIDSRYGEIAEPLEKKVAADPADMESVLELGRAYMSWGYNISYLASVDNDTLHANELFDKAIQMFDSYLASNPEDAGQVKVDRALCLLYAGETSTARTALEAITAEDPENAIAWANLGLVCEISGDTEAARTAYSAAIEHDPDNAQGAKSYASQRILALNTSGSSSEGLSDTLRDLSDTNI